MSISNTRDRRGPLFGPSGSSAQAEARIDPESLERENDKDIDSLAEKTSFLRQLTNNINAEVDGQNRALDGLGTSLSGVQVGLGAAAARFKRVFDDPKKRRNALIIAGVTLGLFLIYLLAQRMRKQ